MTDKQPSSLFNTKPNTKRTLLEGKTTLDNLHQININSLKKEREDISNIDEQISEYNDKLQATNDIVLKSQYEDCMNSLRRKKEDLLNNKPVYDYFFGAGEILFNYYDLQDKIQSGDQMSV